MPEIKCPNCGQIIKLDKSDYDALLSEVEKEEINKRVEIETKLIDAKYKAELALEQNKAKAESEKQIAELKKNLSVLEEKLKASDKDTALAVSKATEIQKEANQQLKQQYEFLLKAKDEEIKRYKEFRMGDSTKDLGESLEQYCHDAFDEIRAVAYPNAYFEKDNDSSDGSKGDFIFRDFGENNVEIVSIMFEMKNQKDDTEHKHKNEDFFKKLDKDRNSKNCEYAVLVSTLEEDSKLYNTGIVDVSHRYPKMFVVRPQFFLTIIGLIRNMALNSFAYKKELVAYKKENLDISNFEDAVRAVADKINTDYEKAAAIYGEVDEMCDAIIKKVENFRKEFKTATGWIEKAKNQLPNLEVRKLTRGNKTMKEKFAELEEKK